MKYPHDFATYLMVSKQNNLDLKKGSDLIKIRQIIKNSINN
jgi:hypothetical protein